MLKQSAVILLTLAALSGVGTSFAQAQPKDAPDAANKDVATLFRSYEPDDKSFQMLYPSDWKVVPGGAGGTVVTFLNEKTAKGGKATEMTSLLILPSRNTLEQLAQTMKEKAAARAGFTLIEDGAFTVGDWKTHRFVFDIKAGDATTRGIQFVMVKDGSAYVMTFYMPPEKFNKEAEDRTFKLCGQFTAGGKQPVVANAGKGTMFESKEFGFTLTYPPGWNKAGAEQKGMALALGRKASAGKVPQIIMVMADNLEPGEKVDLKETEQKLVESSKASVKEARVLEAAEIKLGGEPARRVVLGGMRLADEHEGRLMVVCCIQGGHVIAVLAGAPVEDLSALKGDVDKVVGSFKFGSGKADAETASLKRTTTGAEIKTAPPVAGPTAFDAPQLGMKLSYPAMWTARKSADPTIALILLSTPRPGARPSTIVLTTEAVPAGQRTSLKEQSDAALAAVKISLPDAKVIESADVKIGIEKARRMIIGGHALGTRAEMRSMFLMFQHGSDALTLNGQSTLEDFASLKEAFDGMVSSIELATPTPKRGQ